MINANEFTASTSDTYNHRPIWMIARDFNENSDIHNFDRHGKQLTKIVMNKHSGEQEVVTCPEAKKGSPGALPKRGALSVSRRVVSEEEYKPVGLL